MFKGQSVQEEFREFLGHLRYDRQVVPKRRYGITVQRSLKSQNIEDSFYVTVEGLNLNNNPIRYSVHELRIEQR